MMRFAVWLCAAISVCSLVSLGQSKDDGVVSKASALMRAGRTGQAENLLRSAAIADPKSEAVHALLGRLLFREKNYEDAVEQLGLALQINPDSRENSLLLSEALIGWHHFGVAVDFLNAVRPKFGNYPEFHYDLGLAYYSENKMKEAKSEFEQAVALAPGLDRAQYLLAACIASEGDYTHAVEIFRKLVKEHPNNANYWATLAQMLTQLGSENLPEALRACHRAQALRPHDPHILYVTATVLMQSGDFAGAKPLFERLVALNPNELPAHIALARIYARLGKAELARRETDLVNKIEKENVNKQTAGSEGIAPPQQ